jgi:hypothetical protein
MWLSCGLINGESTTWRPPAQLLIKNLHAPMGLTQRVEGTLVLRQRLGATRALIDHTRHIIILKRLLVNCVRPL